MRGTERLGIELLSVFGLDPVAHIHLAADMGCAHISTGLTQVPRDRLRPAVAAARKLIDQAGELSC